MKFIARPGTPTHAKIAQVMAEIRAADEAARQLVHANQWDPIILQPAGRVGGGVAGVCFSEPPKDWRRTWSEGGRQYYWPIRGRKSTRELLAQLEALPVVGYGRYNKAVGIDSVWSRYGLTYGPEGAYLLDISEHMQHDAPDLEEITTAHYNQLKATAATPPAEEPAKPGAGNS
jgi:hypothetical protein